MITYDSIAFNPSMKNLKYHEQRVRYIQNRKEEETLEISQELCISIEAAYNIVNATMY